MLQHFRTNLKYRIIAIFLAVVIWFVVFEEKNPTQENVINVPLNITNLNQGLVIAQKPNSVNVRVLGRKAAVNNVSSREIEASVNMTTAQVGNNSFPVNIELPQNLKLVAVEPAYAEIKVDVITGIQLPVDVKIIGSTDQYYKKENMRMVPDEVMVFGPRNILDNIGKAYIDINLKSTDNNYVGDLPVKLENKVGTPIYNEWIDIQPGSVEIFLPIVKGNSTRTVPVTYELTGETASGYEVKSVNIYPQTVVISAEEEDMIYKTNYIPLEISLDESSETIKKELLLSFPDGIDPVDNYTVKIVIEIGIKD